MANPDNEKNVEDVFNKYDKDRSGYLDKEEFDLFQIDCAALVESSIYIDFKDVDTSGDGKISYDELKKQLHEISEIDFIDDMTY